MEKESDLTWLARNVHEWPQLNDGDEPTHIFRIGDKCVMQRPHDDIDGSEYTKQQWLAERARLHNKPSWANAPEGYNWRWQNADGGWKFGKGPRPKPDDGFYVTNFHADCGKDESEVFGEVLGDYRNTLEERPDHIPDTGKMASDCDCDGCTDGDDVVIPPPPQYDPDDVAFRPSKYHVRINGKWTDVYDVLWAFNVTNPAIAHAIKKLLKPGQRGHKDEMTDLEEAAHSIFRAMELIDNE